MKPLVSTAHRYLAAVADAGSLRAAARALGLAPSALNRQILDLEAAAGTPLFERTAQGLKPTDAGRILLAAIRQAEALQEDARARLDATKGLSSGTVRIATVESVSVALLPGLVKAFAETHPGIVLDLVIEGSDAVTALAREGEADLGFTFNPRSRDGLDVLFERGLRVGAVVAPSHALARRKSVRLGDCRDFAAAWPARGLSLRAILDTVPDARPGQPHIESNSLRLMATLARDAGFIAFQTVVGIERELAEGRLRFLPLSDPELPLDRLMLVRRSSAVGRLAAAAFAEIAVERLRTWKLPAARQPVLEL